MTAWQNLILASISCQFAVTNVKISAEVDHKIARTLFLIRFI
jgi:hypothetical protein